MVSLKKRGLEAWDERFTHIDDEHFKKGERVDTWFPMDKELPKGILDEEKQDSDSAEGDEEAGCSEVEHSMASANGLLVQDGGVMDVQLRQAGRGSGQAKKQKDIEWFCCKCRHGPMNRNIYNLCIMGSCGHKRCDVCGIE